MCVAVYQPLGCTVKRSDAQLCYESNDDGAGFAYVDSGKLHIHKGFFSFKKFWRAYRMLAADKQAILHFRISTSGKDVPANCHPFAVTTDEDNHPTIAMAHNGILWSGSMTDKESDTAEFVRTMVGPLAAKDPLFMRNDAMMRMLEYAVAPANKLVFLERTGAVQIIGEDYGTWYEDGCWYSNLHWEYGAYYTATAGPHTVRGVNRDFFPPDDDEDGNDEPGVTRKSTFDTIMDGVDSGSATVVEPDENDWPRWSPWLQCLVADQEEWDLAMELVQEGLLPEEVRPLIIKGEM